MQIHAELCHVDTLRCVVRVEARENDQTLGSALGEAQTVEEAEDRAIQRLRHRLNRSDDEPVSSVDQRNTAAGPGITTAPETPSPESPGQADVMVAEAGSVEEIPSELSTDPEDWSDELAAIDLEVRRIGWDREMERTYLERAFGFGSRHRLTRYSDLTGYLRQLRVLQPGDQPTGAAVPIRRGDLIQQGDQMLKQLGWVAETARGFLQKHLGASSRQQLSDEQLLQFNMLLEEQMLNQRP